MVFKAHLIRYTKCSLPKYNDLIWKEGRRVVALEDLEQGVYKKIKDKKKGFDKSNPIYNPKINLE